MSWDVGVRVGSRAIAFPNEDGHKGYENNAGYRNVTRGLVAKGYSDDAVRKVMGGNFLRVFRDVVG